MSDGAWVALSHALRERIAGWARDAHPREACGLLIGSRHGAVTTVTEVTNARNIERARPGERYTVHPEDHLAAQLRAQANGLEVVGAWHSHPNGSASFSATDVAGAEPGWTYVVVALARERGPDLRAFRVIDGRALEERLAPEPAARE